MRRRGGIAGAGTVGVGAMGVGAIGVRAAAVGAVGVVAVLAAGCAAGPGDHGGDPATGSQEVLVSAAASLTDAFGEMATAFERTEPDLEVVLNLGGSSTLREQVLQGAPADVLATADPATMAQVVDADLTAGPPATFARNELRIAVPAGNPGGVSGLADLADPELLVGLCARGVPCGDLARAALAAAGVDPATDTDEPDVRALLAKIASGELDAGLVYATDVAAAGADVEGIDLPADVEVTTGYQIAVLAEARDPQGAAELVAFVRSPAGQEILARHGFAAP